MKDIYDNYIIFMIINCVIILSFVYIIGLFPLLIVRGEFIGGIFCLIIGILFLKYMITKEFKRILTKEEDLK